MKIRSDFVSNSSSSSFIILAHKDYSNQKVAEDFVDYAFNIKDLYIWENYLEQYLDNKLFFDVFSERFPTEESKIEYLRHSYENGYKDAQRYSDPEKLNKDVKKLVNLFSYRDKNKQIYLPYPYEYDDSLEHCYTGKLTSEEIKKLLTCYINEQNRLTKLKTELESMSDNDYKQLYQKVREYYDYLLENDDISKASELFDKEYIEKWYGTLSFKEKQYYLDYINSYLKTNAEDYQHWLDNISGIDNLDDYNVYVINVANSGDGEDSDTIYSYLSDRNDSKYEKNKYCFTIMSVEPM